MSWRASRTSAKKRVRIELQGAMRKPMASAVRRSGASSHGHAQCLGQTTLRVHGQFDFLLQYPPGFGDVVQALQATPHHFGARIAIGLASPKAPSLATRR